MSLDLTSPLGLSFDSDISDRVADFQPEVIAFVDLRGRRLLTPLRGRRLAQKPCAVPSIIRKSTDTDSIFVSGTIH